MIVALWNVSSKSAHSWYLECLFIEVSSQRPTPEHCQFLNILSALVDITRRLHKLENIELKNNDLENNSTPLFRSSPDYIRAQKNFEAASYKKLMSAGNIDEFTIKISQILRKMGFSTFSFICLTNSPRFLLSNLPDALMHSYQKKNFINSDYAFLYGQSTPVAAPIFRSTIMKYMAAAPVETHDMARNRELSNLYKCHGFYDYYLIPISSGSACYLLSVTTQASDMDVFYKNITAHEQELALLADLLLHLGLLKFKKLFQTSVLPRKINLHSKPVKLLKTLVENDLTLEQTADKLGISLNTADKHSASIRRALGTRTMTGAVHRAIKRGIIDA